MACQALGRCRICARKHKIAVFGGEKVQHFFIEKANLKLIILNTVCLDCIDKVEHLIKKVELDMVLKDYMKDDNYQREKTSKTKVSDEQMMITTQSEPDQVVDDSSKSMTMMVDQPSSQHEDNSIESKMSSESCNSSNHIANTTDTQPQPQYPRDSQLAITTRRRSLRHQITKDISAEMKPLNEPNRKRCRNASKKHLEKKETGPNSKNALPASNSSSTILSATLKISLVNCRPSVSSSEVKKGSHSVQCDFCEKEFMHSSGLKKHRRKHTGEKPYECNQCTRKFAHASNLTRHRRVHSGERPFFCTRCRRHFSRRDKLVTHVRAARCQKNTNNSNPRELTGTKRIKT